MPPIILQGGLLVSPHAPDADGGAATILPDATLVLRNGCIEEISQRRYVGAEVVDCSQRIVMPGLCNAHIHSEFLLLRGLLEDRRLHVWEDDADYMDAWDRLEQPLDESLLRPAYLASYVRQALGGITCVGEFNCIDGSAHVSQPLLEAVGLVGTASAKLTEHMPGGGARESFLPFVSLHHELGLTHEELEAAADKKLLFPATRMTLHAAETRERMQAVQERFGTSTLRLLERFGLLWPGMLLSHAVHLDAEELQLLATRGATVVASPTAEMKLADGISAIPALLQAGVPVALGTDCATCNNDADLFLEMKTLGLLHKVTSGADALPAATLLAFATRCGYSALGFPSGGRLEVGARADVALLDRFSPTLAPVVHSAHRSNVLAALVYGATGAAVTDTMVGGEWVVRHGQPVRFSLRTVMEDLQAATERLWLEVDANRDARRDAHRDSNRDAHRRVSVPLRPLPQGEFQSLGTDVS